jgi:hypothetical protein
MSTMMGDCGESSTGGPPKSRSNDVVSTMVQLQAAVCHAVVSSDVDTHMHGCFRLGCFPTYVLIPRGAAVWCHFKPSLKAYPTCDRSGTRTAL